MAKSLRSKWKRKMRAVKRVRYGEKELARLKKIVGESDVKNEVEEIMTDISEVVTITDAKTIKEQSEEKNDSKEHTTENEDKMEDDTVIHKYSSKTLRDQFGSYPVWLHQRKISKKKKVKKSRQKKK